MPNPPLRRTSNIRLETINAGAYLATARIPDAHTDRDSYELVVRGVNRQEQEGGEASNGGAGGVGGKASGDGGAMGGKAGGGALGGRADEIGLRGMRPAIVTTNSTRSESQEEILPPEGRVLVRRDLVSKDLLVSNRVYISLLLNSSPFPQAVADIWTGIAVYDRGASVRWDVYEYDGF